MPIYFDVKDTYVIGKRKKNCINNMNVEFVNAPEPITLSGVRLIEEYGIQDWETYLKENPNNFKPTDTIVLTKLQQGDKIFLTQGQPYTKKVVDVASSLADGGTALQVYNQQRQVSSDLTKTYNRQISDYQQRITDLESRITELQDRDIDNTKEIIKITAENKSLKKDLEITQREFNDYKERFGKHLEKAEEAQTLNDTVSTVMDGIGPFLGLGAQFLSALINQKFGGNNQLQAPQQQIESKPLVQSPNANANAEYLVNEQETFK